MKFGRLTNNEIFAGLRAHSSHRQAGQYPTPAEAGLLLIRNKIMRMADDESVFTKIIDHSALAASVVIVIATIIYGAENEAHKKLEAEARFYRALVQARQSCPSLATPIADALADGVLTNQEVSELRILGDAAEDRVRRSRDPEQHDELAEARKLVGVPEPTPCYVTHHGRSLFE